ARRRGRRRRGPPGLRSAAAAAGAHRGAPPHAAQRARGVRPQPGGWGPARAERGRHGRKSLRGARAAGTLSRRIQGVHLGPEERRAQRRPHARGLVPLSPPGEPDGGCTLGWIPPAAERARPGSRRAWRDRCSLTNAAIRSATRDPSATISFGSALVWKYDRISSPVATSIKRSSAEIVSFFRSSLPSTAQRAGFARDSVFSSRPGRRETFTPLAPSAVAS